MELLYENLSNQLNDIALKYNSVLERAYNSIAVCRNLLSNLKKEIIKNGFRTIEEEIHFFKCVKQIPLVKLIYFSEVHSFEIQFPKADEECQLKCIKRKINKINRFFLYNLDFGRYIESGQTHFDKEYFTREHLNGYHITLSKFYFQDPEFCTARDMLLGKYKAYQDLVTYLNDKKQSSKSKLIGHSILQPQNNKLHWPFSNTDYVELLYALCSKGLGNRDNLPIAKVSEKLQKVFDFEPKDIYKTYQEIKNRKKSRTSFLDELSASLLLQMDKSEE